MKYILMIAGIIIGATLSFIGIWIKIKFKQIDNAKDAMYQVFSKEKRGK
jgi:hypothetical protein